MDATFLQSLKTDYPDFHFKSATRFSFRPPKTIFYNPDDPNFQPLILHELGHATLHHQTFTTNIDRLKMERAAWTQAQKIASKYSMTIPENLIETELDTYRDWLHQKSTCPHCGLTRYETNDGQYHCPHCENFTKPKK